MDPLEARLYFTRQLKSMSAALQQHQELAKFAMKNRDLQEDFHSVILEVMDAVDLNVKLNVFDFVEVLVEETLRIHGSDVPYQQRLLDDMPFILSKVVPDDGKGLANLNTSVTTLANLSHSLAFEAVSKYIQIFETIGDSKAEIPKFIDSNCRYSAQLAECWVFVIKMRQKGRTNRAQEENRILTSTQNGTSVVMTATPTREMSETPRAPDNGSDSIHPDESMRESPAKKSEIHSLLSFPNQQILARMEQDRERNKKAKESLWIVERTEGRFSKTEFNAIYERHSPLTEEDYNMLAEVKAMVQESISAEEFHVPAGKKAKS